MIERSLEIMNQCRLVRGFFHEVAHDYGPSGLFC